MLDLKKGDQVILKGFTGVKLGVFPVNSVTKKTVTVLKRNGDEMIFDRKTGKQVNVAEGKERYANSIIEDDGNGATGADSTVFYINGNVYMTVYGNSYAVDDAFLAEEDFNLVGYDMVAVDYNIASVDSWYADAELTEGVTSDRPEAVYTMVDASDVRVTISVGTAISLYVDNIKYTSGQTAVLSVGTHTVTTQVNPGYSGTVSVQFNGQTINGSFTITPEMASAAYSGDITLTATGDITYDAGSVTVDNSDDGMGITDYLLIILVVLVIILAIFVALRMMRS